MPVPFFHHRSCYLFTLLIVLVTLLSAANPWKELLIPNQNGRSDLKDCIMPFVMHSAPLPVQQGDFIGSIAVFLSFCSQ